MASSLARRGPDAEGLESWPSGAVFGHRRLSIFDLSEAGKQPMLTDDGRLGVVFNGAIYNFHELRAELVQAGYRFHSQTDTEVLLHGYRHWGIEKLIARLRGMFAIGLWDEDSRRLFLIRDRLGVKPLFYKELEGGGIAFASTARALRDAGVAGGIDEQAIADFLEFGYVTDARAIYRQTFKVPAATAMEWHNNRIVRQWEYWQPAETGSSTVRSFEEAVEQTESIFLDAVRLRLEADVPVGTLLSGGVDSSLVCWAIAKLGGDVRAFTIGTPNDPWDESGDAAATARTLGIRHDVINVSAEDAPDVHELTSAYGEPFACASALGMLRVCRAVKPYATVLLTGDGGDDVFLGYPEHKNLWMAQKAAAFVPTFASRLWPSVRQWIPQTGIAGRAVHFADYSMGGLGAVADVHDGLPVFHRDGLLGERMRDATVSQRDIPWSLPSGRRVLSDFLAYDRKTRFVGEYLTKVDGGAMHYAVEARSPFLDQVLWNFAASLPFEIRLHGGTLKAVLRELARRRIGERVASGRKRGFGVPVQRWLAGKWRAGFEELMRDSVLGREGFINPQAVLQSLGQSAQRGFTPNQLWYVFVLEQWFRQEQTAASPARATVVPSVP